MPGPRSPFPEFQRFQAHMDEMWARLTGGQMGGLVHGAFVVGGDS